MKTVGILGGFGPETTAQFQLKIVELFRAKKIQVRPSILMFEASIPLEKEKNLIIKSRGINSFLPFLIDGVKHLQNGGADFIVLPCNTLHILLPKLQKNIDLPILDLIQETAKSLKEKEIDKVAILATKQTIKSNIHQKRLRLKGIIPIIPSKIDQEKINIMISRLLANKDRKKSKEELRSVIEKLKLNGVKNILLACTDLQQIFPKIEGVVVHDTLDILAKSTVKYMLNERR
jgi:aspartate racemase